MRNTLSSRRAIAALFSILVVALFASSANATPFGYFDSCTPSSVNAASTISGKGWAADPSTGAPVQRVEIRVDGTTVLNATLGSQRQDVVNAFGRSDYLNSGWTFSYSASGLSAGTHTFSAWAFTSSGSAQLSGTFSVTAAAPTPPLGYFDNCQPYSATPSSTMTGNGWAADQVFGAPVQRVEIRVDGVRVVNATLGAQRQDVANYYGRSDYLNSGWTFSWPVTGLSSGTHIFSAWAFNNSGQSAQLNLTYSITVSGGNSAPTSSLSSSSNSITLGQSITLTSTITDPDGNLSNQAVDISTDGTNYNSGWNNWSGQTAWNVSGGSATNTITYTPPSAGTYYFRSRGQDTAGLLSPFVYQTVTVSSVNHSPVTTISASASSSINGNSNSGSPPMLSVASGQTFTITSVTTDQDSNLITQQFDLSTDGGATWSLANSGNGRLWSGPATGSNTLSKLFGLGDGTYRFRAQGQDSAGAYSTYQYVDVRIGNAPAITTQPTSQTVSQGATVTFTVAASGSTPLSYQWRKNGTAISGATNTSLSLTNVQSTDAATYSCYVSNFVGSTTSNGATLTVNAPPPPPPAAPVITSPTTATGTAGSSFSYWITASNSPSSYSASGLPNGLSVNSTSGQISGTPAVAGTYPVTISATNAGGTGSATLTLNVGGATATPLPLGLNVHRPGN
jgi:hypothetical protein